MQHKAVYINNRGDVFTFGTGNVWQLQGANGIAVDLDLTSGYNNVGNAVNSASVGGGTLTITGSFATGSLANEKQAMSKAFAFNTSGILTIEDTYSIDVEVKSTPAYSRNNADGKFSLQLFAPIPFFRTKDQEFVDIGGITPQFNFPINYGTPHRFGSRNPNKYKTIINNGTQPTDMSIEFVATADCSNFVVTNLETLAQTRFTNASLQAGERLLMERNAQGILEVTFFDILEQSSDVLYLLDDESNLFQLDVGENIIQGEALNGNDNLIVNIKFYERQELTDV